MSDNEIMKREEQALASQTEGPLGFDDDDADDMIIPRVKIIQLLSPERKNGEANEGDIINSLTKEKLNGKKFIPVFKFNNNIDWKSKLTSRKFWVAVIGFVVPLLIAFGFTDNQATEVASIIMAGANMIAYIIGEGMVDSSRIQTETKSTITTIKGETTTPVVEELINNGTEEGK